MQLLENLKSGLCSSHYIPIGSTACYKLCKIWANLALMIDHDDEHPHITKEENLIYILDM